MGHLLPLMRHLLPLMPVLAAGLDASLTSAVAPWPWTTQFQVC